MIQRKLGISVFVIAFSVLSLLVVPVFAQEETTEASDPESSETTERPGMSKEERDARKAERKERIEERVDQARLTQAAARCTGAQNALEAAVNRVEGVQTRRTEQYGKISEKLNGLTNRIRATDIDTTNLEAQIEQFDTLVQEFYAELNVYYLALSDASEMDCEADAEAFLLAVEDARESVPTLKDMAKAIRSQVRDTIVSTLRSIADELSNKTSDDAGTDDETPEESESETETGDGNESTEIVETEQ